MLSGLTIIGTSNSLVKGGYTSVLSDRFSEIRNVSLGASTSVLHGFRTRELESQLPGYAVFDHAVNESVLNAKYQMSLDIQQGAFESFLALCSAGAMRPVVLIMPSGWAYSRTGPVRAGYLERAREFGLPFLDGFTLNERIYDLADDFRKCGYIEAAHAEPPIMRMVGRALARGIAKVDAMEWRSQELGDASRLNCIYVDDHLESDLLVERSSSVTKSKFARLTPGNRVSLPIAPGTEIVGVAFNSGTTNAVLKIDAGEVRTKHLQSHVYGTHQFRVIVWPFDRPILALSDTFSIECLPADVGEADERNDAISPNTDLSNPTIEISGFITRKTEKAGSFERLEQAADMLSLLSDDELLEDVRIERPTLPTAYLNNGGGKVMDSKELLYLLHLRLKTRSFTLPYAARTLQNTVDRTTVRGGFGFHFVREGLDDLVKQGKLAKEGDSYRIINVEPSTAQQIEATA